MPTFVLLTRLLPEAVKDPSNIGRHWAWPMVSAMLTTVYMPATQR